MRLWVKVLLKRALRNSRGRPVNKRSVICFPCLFTLGTSQNLYHTGIFRNYLIAMSNIFVLALASHANFPPVIEFWILTSSGSSGRVRGGGEKHEIYAAAFGGHLFYDLFSQGRGGHSPLAPPGSATAWQKSENQSKKLRIWRVLSLKPFPKSLEFVWIPRPFTLLSIWMTLRCKFLVFREK